MNPRGSDLQVPVRAAATVVLLRDAAGGLEVWLLRRVRGLAFAGGASVFAGGRVDDADHGEVAGLPVSGEHAARLADRLGCSVADARASTVAAIRETFEETGVLLTRPVGAVGADVGTAADGRWLRDQRRRVEAHERSFSSVLTELEVAVDADLIRAWARWITPVGEPRRYDTAFYVAALPRGATAHPETTEASDAGWIAPAAALAEYKRGERPMLAPTVVTLGELTAFTRVHDVLAAADARSLTPVEPELVNVEGGVTTVRLPDGRHFPRLPAGR